MKSFLYLHTADLAASRHFYTQQIGLDEIFHSDADQTVGYLHGTLQLTIALHPNAARPDGWSRQLGWAGGTGDHPSWGFELEARHFATAVTTLIDDGVPAWQAQPSWVGYWSFPVRDPMGHTLELTTPDRESWPSLVR